MKKHYILSIVLCLITFSLHSQNWQIYNADVVPADAGFSSNGGSANSVVNVIPDPDIPGNNLAYFISPDEGAQYSFTNQLTSTVNELTLVMRVRGIPGVDTLVRLFDLDVRFAAVDLREKFIIDYDDDVKFERSGAAGEVAGAADWHIWRFVCDGAANNWAVYVDEDNTPILESASPDGTGDQYFKMGDGSGGNSMGALIDWVVWDTTGAYTPEEVALPPLTGIPLPDNPKIAFLTQRDWVFYDTYGYYADSLFVADLEEQGYEVTVLDYNTYISVAAEEDDVLKRADLVILGRGISSGDFDDPDDFIWTDLKTPVMLMSNFVARANRLGYIRSNSVEDFARLDTFYAEVVNTADPIFDGLDIPADGIVPYAEDYLGAILANETMVNGEVLLRLEGVGTAYRIDNGNGNILETFDMADFDENVLMARWAPGDSMYLSSNDLPGFLSVVPNGYRSYVTVGHDREFDTDLNTRIRDYYVFTDFSRQAWLNEVANLIELGSAGNADLQSIEIDGVPISFDPDDMDISFEFFAGTAPGHMPFVTATPKAEDATVSITQPANAISTATIEVTADDGITSRTYNLSLSVREGNGLIVYVTNQEWVAFDTYGPYADSLFVNDLQSVGYDVRVTPYSNYIQVDSMEARALEMADLVVLGRGISSGDFDDPDDEIWAELETPVMLMSNFVVRANRLGWIRSNTTEDFARLDVYQANANKRNDPIFAGVSVPPDGIFPFAEENLGIIVGGPDKTNGDVLVTLEGVGTANRIDNGNGNILATFDLADFDENILMARWAPGDSMYMSNPDLPGFLSVVPNGYRSYMTVGHDREFDTDLNTRIRDYYSLTNAGNTLWLNEVDNLIGLAGENPAASKYALLDDLTLDGNTVTGFDPLIFYYEVALSAGSPVPATIGVPSYPNAIVTYDLPATLPGIAFVNVASQDGSTNLTYTVFIDLMVGVSDPKLAGINIYPNPISDYLTIDLPTHLQSCKVTMQTALGQVISYSEVSGPQARLNMQAFSPGMYIIRIEADGKFYTQKLLKQ